MPMREMEELCEAAEAVLAAFNNGDLGEIQDPDTLQEFETLEEKITAARMCL